MSAVPEPKKITAEEYLRIAETRDDRTELLDGEIVMMGSPNTGHQRIVRNVGFEIHSHIRRSNGQCEVFLSPYDVLLDEENVVQPDVLVVCDPSKIDGKRCNGAPDWVIEVTSTNRIKDFTLKLWLYQRSGVREYWILDSKYERVHVFFFEDDQSPEIYDFQTPIPVRIYDGKLSIRIADLM